jgi:hypothetical protein
VKSTSVLPMGTGSRPRLSFFGCQREISTDEKSYVGRIGGDKKWGFAWYYERLYGTLPDVWPSESA